jgi:hypothetical protein
VPPLLLLSHAAAVASPATVATINAFRRKSLVMAMQCRIAWRSSSEIVDRRRIGCRIYRSFTLSTT